MSVLDKILKLFENMTDDEIVEATKSHYKCDKCRDTGIVDLYMMMRTIDCPNGCEKSQKWWCSHCEEYHTHTDKYEFGGEMFCDKYFDDTEPTYEGLY